MTNDVKEIINNWFRNNAKIKDKRHKRTYIYTLGDNNIEVILNNGFYKLNHIKNAF